MDPFDFNWFMLCPCAMSFFQRLCSVSFASVSYSFPEPHPGPQCRLYNLLEAQPKNRWPLGGKYCIISKPSRYSALHLPCFLQHVQHQHLSVNPPGRAATPASLSEPSRAGDRHTMPARNPSAGIPSKAIGLPGIMFATL